MDLTVKDVRPRDESEWKRKVVSREWRNRNCCRVHCLGLWVGNGKMEEKMEITCRF